MAVFQTKPSQKPHKNFYAYYRKDLTRIRYKRRKPPAVTIYRENFAPKKFTGKEQDQETGLYYYGARYLDPKTSRWLSTDPALGDYLPVAPNNDEAKKHNQNLPGMGGVFNVVNLHVYHYAGNNPVKYVDPDGRKSGLITNVTSVGGAGHSGVWVELYNESGGTDGYAFFEVKLQDTNAHEKRSEKPLTKWMALLGGSSAGSSVGSLSNGAKGAIVGASAGAISGVIINEEAVVVCVNEYRFKTRDEMKTAIAKMWSKDETTINEIRQTAFNTSVAQDLLILGAAVSEGDSFGRYDILFNNCVQYASKVLSAGGVKTSLQPVPNWSHNYIDKNNQYLIER